MTEDPNIVHHSNPYKILSLGAGQLDRILESHMQFEITCIRNDKVYWKKQAESHN